MFSVQTCAYANMQQTQQAQTSKSAYLCKKILHGYICIQTLWQIVKMYEKHSGSDGYS